MRRGCGINWNHNPWMDETMAKWKKEGMDKGAWIDGWMSRWEDKWMDGKLGGWQNGSMDCTTEPFILMEDCMDGRITQCKVDWVDE